MRTWVVSILFCLASNFCFSQLIVSNRVVDFSNRPWDFIPQDYGNQLIIADSNNYICQVSVGNKAFYIRNRGYFNPTILISDSSFNLRDTISFSDTARVTTICYDRTRKQIWMVNGGYFSYIYKFRKLNFTGEVLAENTWFNTSSALLIPSSIQKLYADDNGGFYLLGSRSTTMSGQSVEPWMVSRFDSNGTVMWQREYIYTYAYGSPQYLEKLPNGKLYVSGYAGRQIYSIEIDPATGTASNRKVIYNYPDPTRSWSEGHAIRCPNGKYFVRAYCPRITTGQDSSAVMATVDSSLRTTWQNYSRYPGVSPIAIKDSTVWLMKNDNNTNMCYSHYDMNGNRLHNIILFTTNDFDANHLNDVAHYSNGNAAFIGSTNQPSYVGGALYFCKISRIGVPYNPTYPAWPPIPTIDTTAVASISNEPALQLYPNPGHATMHVSHTGELYLYNLQGQLVMQCSTQAGDVISTSTLPSGAYLAHFQTKTGWLTSCWIKE